MSLPTKRSATSTTSNINNNSSSSSSNPNPNPASPPPFSAMKKAKSQAAALDPKNGLHHQDFNSNSNNSDVVFDPSSMSVDDDFKPHDSSAPSPSPAPPRAVAANLSRKKAQPPQPPKKLVIKLLKAKPTLPANFEEDTWAKLKSAISAIFLKQPDPIDSEILYQAVNDLCLHKLGGNLYQRIEKECEAHISEALQSLFGQSPDLVVFLSLVERCWQDLCDQMLLIRGIALYLDRTYVKQTPNVRSLWDMGLQLFRKHLSLSPEVEHKTVTGLLRMIQSERLGEAVDRTLLNHLLKMFTALGIYAESFEKPFLECTSERKPTLKIEGRSANRSCAFLDAFNSTLPGSPLVRPAKKWEEATHELQDKKKKHQHDICKHPSNQPHATTSLVNASSTNSEQHVLPSDRAAPDSAPAEQTCGGNSDIAMKNVNGQGNSNIAMKDVNGQKCLSSSRSLEKIRKPSPELTNDLGKEFTTTKRSSQQLDLRKRLNSIYDSVLLVDNITTAREVVGMLTNKYGHLVHACDTEVAKIEVKQETPVDHGEIICFSIYSGPEADFGNGKSCIWVDVLDGGGRDLLVEFAPFFEDPSIKKVWHNYSFDNHIIENYGLKVSGFHADTIHMARLWDSSRRTKGGYSLEALTSDKKVMSGIQLGLEEDLFGKISMKNIFGTKKIKKDGSEGKIITISPVEILQREERKPWICYSVLDAKSTLKLYESLKSQLSQMQWKLDGKTVDGKHMFDFYEEYWRPFGELLIKMETEGMLVDRKYLAEVEKVAKAEQEIAANRFRSWASRYCSDAQYMNVGSDAQLRQLFFGGIANSKDPDETLPIERIFKVPNVDKVIEDGKKSPTKYRNISLSRILNEPLPTDIFTASGWPSVSGDALKTLAGKVSAEYDFVNDEQPDDNIESAFENEVSEEQKSTVDEDKSAYGIAFQAFEKEEDGREACHAISALCEVCSIDSLISNFILPLQGSNISGKNGRIHCSLNINTETGRLSARRPNLQNQPALEKDRYKIRQAFIASPGNSLIVADYGQLELRILAHLASCKSMKDAFRLGGDFHSRTAMNMYPYIREAIDKKHVLLEWHPQPGEDKPPVPLLKDAFASERRKAKMLNFSIAYGKTPVGLSRDWKVSVQEAKKTVDLWYSDRKEVLNWQEERKKEAREKNCVHTLLGRARQFPSVAQATNSQKGHIERAAINTPVQGSAADVAMCAMLEISKNARLKELGWKLLLQVHDEVILEGPTESAEVAKAIVVECMSKPFNGKNILQVDLSVDAKCAQNWYSAK